MGQTTSSICAVVVSYHPDSDVLENLLVLRPQVDHLVVVDNGSTEVELQPLRRQAGELGYTLIENGDNLGIAAALNTGVQWAQQAGNVWVILFDQDSHAPEGFVQTMLGWLAARADRDRIAIVNPQYRDARSLQVIPRPVYVDGGLEQCTTSGSLMPMSIFERAGLFAEELFIDGVDYEYSLRVRELGYTIQECEPAFLMHSPGTPSYHTLFGKRYQVANYPGIRRYYQERNKVLLIQRYWRRFLPFFLRQFRVSLKDLAKIVLHEDDKLSKLSSIARGVGDGLRHKTGKLAG